MDFARWFSAMVVVISHVRHLLFVNLKDVAAKTIWVKGFYFFTGFGHEAVMVFFVLSGFLVGGGCIRKLRQGTFDSAGYMISRFSRIYTVLVPALLLGGLLDTIGLRHFNDSAIYTDSPQYQTASLNFQIVSQLGLSTFLGNLLCLQTICVPMFGSNGPLWSLANEWWYYCIFLLLIAPFGGFRRAWAARVAFAAGCLLLLLFPLTISLWFAIWGLGLLIGAWEFRFVRLPVWMAAAVFAGVLVWARLGHSTEGGEEPVFARFSRDLPIGMAFTLMLLAIKNAGRFNVPAPSVHRFLAGFSYSLYVVHFPLLILLAAVANDLLRQRFVVQPSISGIVPVTVAVVILYLASVLFWLLTERHYHRIGSWMRRWLLRKPIPMRR